MQGVCLALFLVLFFAAELSPSLTRGEEYRIGVPTGLFFDLDPLVALIRLRGGSGWTAASALCLLVLLSALLFNRAFCGWVCPLGALHQIASSGRRAARRVRPGFSWKWNPWRNAKLWILIGMLAALCVGVDWIGVLDPFAFLTRSLATVVHPASGWLVDMVVAGLDRAGGEHLSDLLLKALRGRLIPFVPRVFLGATVLGLLFLLSLGLNRMEKRFWCRYVCPLGALLGLLAHWAPLRLRREASACTECGRCLKECQGGDQPCPRDPWVKPECLVCVNCVRACPEGVLSFSFGKPGTDGQALADPSRRFLLGSLVVGVLVGLLQEAEMGMRGRGGRFSGKLIRPPGACPEPRFLELCSKCGACMKVCPTNALQPASWQSGPGGLWTPVLVPRIGFCDDHCTLCGQVCPTGAIRPLSLVERLGRDDREPVRIGLAHIDRSQCLPWAKARACLVCEEVCPTVLGRKAILLKSERVRGEDGRMVEVQRPVVNPESCIGCGICENRCPLASSGAIVVTSEGESRARAPGNSVI